MNLQEDIVRADIKCIIEQNLQWGLLNRKTVLVTGAAGLLGTYIVGVLMALGGLAEGITVNVVCLVRNKGTAEKKFSLYLSSPNFHLIVQDVIKPLFWQGPIDYIVHAASPASPKGFSIDPVGTLSANVLGSFHLLELAQRKGTKGFLLISSGEVYGDAGSTDRLIDEESYGYLNPLSVRSCYAESKRLAETMCISWMHQYGVNIKVARPFHTYGPGLRLDDGRVFADFVADVVNGRDITIKSGGTAIRNFSYIADTVAAFFFILIRGKDGEAYNVANRNGEISIKDLAKLMVSLVPDAALEVKFSTRSPEDQYSDSPIVSHRPSVEKLRNLGWQPKYSLEEGFLRTIHSLSNCLT